MFRPGTKKTVRVFCNPLFFLLPLLLQSSCSAAQVLGVSRQEAAELLRAGDTGFIVQAELPAGFSKAASKLKQLLDIHPGAPYYAALLIGKEKNFQEALLYYAALESPSVPVKREAALKLIPFILESKETGEAQALLSSLDSNQKKTESFPAFRALRAACLYRLCRYSEIAKLLQAKQKQADSAASWEKAISLLAALKASPSGSEKALNEDTLKRDIFAFLFEGPIDEAKRWAYKEALSSEGFPGLTEGSVKAAAESAPKASVEAAALSTRFSPVNYAVTLRNLKAAMSDGGVIFFRYPDLIADLGRAYQYTPSMRKEGAELFRAWDRLLETKKLFSLPASLQGTEEPGDYQELLSFVGSLGSDEMKIRKFMVLFYAGRIERAMENYSDSLEFFRRARGYAPDEAQSDSCVWYMLMNALTKDPAAVASLVLNTMHQWNDISYFDDILDRLSRYLVSGRQWGDLYEIFLRLEGRGSSPSLAQYAWILGRAVQEGYFDSEGQKTAKSAESFFRIAFADESPLYYYRIMAASALNESFVPEKEYPESGKSAADPEAEFILGFFDYGAAAYAMPYISAREEELTALELRRIAEALASSGRQKESLDLVSRYIRREYRRDYRQENRSKDSGITRQDLCLLYPRPFLETAEKYSAEAELPPEVLFGLIRTESFFLSDVVSRSGAVGLTQLMPDTAEEMAGRIVRQGGPDYRGSKMNLKDPELNIHIGSFYMRYLKDQMGSLMPAVLAYNGGMGRVRRWLAEDKRKSGGGLPLDLFLETVEFTETREYGRRILAAAAIYGYLYYGKSIESAAAEMYPSD